MSHLRTAQAHHQRPSVRLRQRLEILSLPRWRLWAHIVGGNSSLGRRRDADPLDYIAAEKSRDAELLEEMRLNHDYDPTRIRILEELVGNLDERGFLRDSVAAIANRLQLSEKDVSGVRHDLQHFEDQGIGSLHFVDFLLFQLAAEMEKCGDDCPRRMYQIFSQVQRTIKTLDFIPVMRRIGGKLDGKILSHLRSGKLRLSPWAESSETIKGRSLPDVFVRLENGFLHVDVPRDSQDLLAEGQPTQGWKNFHATRAAMILREGTLKNVCERIFSHQMPFLLEGISALEPLIQRKIADELDLAPSTISRTIAAKYAHTPHGTFPLGYFLPKDLCSSFPYVNHLMRAIVDDAWENIFLSDQKMAERIREKFKLKISRRVIAHCRRNGRPLKNHCQRQN
jgi:RNA polymerase sigma-54 factor